MKASCIYLAVIVFASIMLILFACYRDPVPSDELALRKTERSGCFNYTVRSETNYSIQTDTLTYEILNDTLLLYANLPYNCCGLLADSVSIEGNLFKSYVKDTCRQGCLCKCLCVFKYTYHITGYEDKTTRFQLYLKGYETKEFKLWKEICLIRK